MNKVLVLNQFALPSTEAGGTRHSELFRRLHGWRHLILAGDRNHYSQNRFATAENGFELIRVPASDGGVRSRLVAWIAYLVGAGAKGFRYGPADVVYASSPHLLVPFAGWLLAKRWRAKLVVEIRDLWPESFVSMGIIRHGSVLYRALRFIERRALHLADHVVAVTPGWEDHFESLGLGRDGITVIPNGASMRPLSQSLVSMAERRLSGVPRPRGVFAGAHGPKDGIDSILETARQLPCVSFVLIGDGPDKIKAIQQAKLEDLHNVYFFDPLPKAELYEFLSCFDFGVHSVSALDVFQKGMSPNKLFDYMAAGLPVASNGGKALGQIVESRSIGSLNDGDLPSAVKNVCDAPVDLVAEWKRSSQELLGERFGRDAVAKRLERLLDSLA